MSFRPNVCKATSILHPVDWLPAYRSPLYKIAYQFIDCTAGYGLQPINYVIVSPLLAASSCCFILRCFDMQRLFRPILRTTVFTTSVFVCLSALALETKVETLKPVAVQSKIAIEIVSQLSKHHYRKQELNDLLSSRFLDEYLKNLDSSKNFFLASDIAEFDTYRKTFDDDFKAGKLNNGFAIYNRFSERLIRRLDETINLLDKKDFNFSFDQEEFITIDRKNEPWPANQETAISDVRDRALGSGSWCRFRYVRALHLLLTLVDHGFGAAILR